MRFACSSIVVSLRIFNSCLFTEVTTNLNPNINIEMNCSPFRATTHIRKVTCFHMRNSAKTAYGGRANELVESRADWNEDRIPRLMRLRPKCVSRLRRRWERLNPKPRIPLGTLRRRYHATLAGHLNDQIS